jgi:phage terminase small subunit
MTDKQQAFITHYVSSGFNHQESAIKAGYSKKSAGPLATELLKKPEVLQGVKKEIKRVLKDVDKLTIRWLNKITEIAFSSPNSYVTKTGDTVVSYSDQMKALDLLGKYLCLYSEKFIFEEESESKQLTREEQRQRIIALAEKLK